VSADARRWLRVSVRRSLIATVVSGALLTAPTAARAEGAALAGGPGVGGSSTVMLSNLRTLSRWAYPQASTAVHESPSPGSRVVAHTRFLTAEGQAEVYLLLRATTVGEVTWILLSVPGRPNGLVGWVPSSALSEFEVVREYLRVDRARFRAVLYRDGHPIWSAAIGVGRASAPTPAGHFYVTERLTTVGDPVYGPYAIGTSAYSPTLSEWPGGGVVGIHGTDEPQLIPGRPSHGCIRLRNLDITQLWRLIGVGTPIEIV
jgi:L,D-transpeptidase catalytic domain